MKVFFIDTNILVDVALAREPHHQSAKDLLRLALEKKVRLITTPICLSTTLYWLQKGNPNDQQLADDARRMLRFFLQVVELAPVNSSHFLTSADSGFKDLEDGTQYAAAIAMSPLDAIVTRDPSVFKPYVQEPVLDAGSAVKLVKKT